MGRHTIRIEAIPARCSAPDDINTRTLIQCVDALRGNGGETSRGDLMLT